MNEGTGILGILFDVLLVVVECEPGALLGIERFVVSGQVAVGRFVALLDSQANKNLIEQFTRNWEIERIAFMDIVIMIVALAEITSFPSIPLQVSFNEYIEIAKSYSTAKSGTFINGVLEAITSLLKKEGRLEK